MEEECLDPRFVTLFCGFTRLEEEDDKVLVRELEEHTILVENPEAGGDVFRELAVEKDTFLIAGSTRKFVAPKKVTGGSVHKIEPPYGKFAIVVHEEGEKNGEKKYKVKRYQEKREGKLELKVVDGKVEVFLGTEKLPFKEMVYDEARRNQGVVANIKTFLKFVAGVVQDN